MSIRFRSVGFSKAMPRKVAYATQQFHEERDSVNAYIVMENEEEARKAVAENSTVFEGRHLRVDIASAERVKEQEDRLISYIFCVEKRYKEICIYRKSPAKRQ